MNLKRKLAATGLALGLAATSAVAVTATAAPAQAAVCKSLGQSSKWGRTWIVWSCGGSIHGQLKGGQAGDSITMVASTGRQTITFGATIPKGKTSVNTASKVVTPMQAIFKAGDRPERFWIEF